MILYNWHLLSAWFRESKTVPTSTISPVVTFSTKWRSAAMFPRSVDAPLGSVIFMDMLKSRGHGGGGGGQATREQGGEAPRNERADENNGRGWVVG